VWVDKAAAAALYLWVDKAAAALDLQEVIMARIRQVSVQMLWARGMTRTRVMKALGTTRLQPLSYFLRRSHGTCVPLQKSSFGIHKRSTRRTPPR